MQKRDHHQFFEEDCQLGFSENHHYQQNEDHEEEGGLEGDEHFYQEAHNDGDYPGWATQNQPGIVFEKENQGDFKNQQQKSSKGGRILQAPQVATLKQHFNKHVSFGEQLNFGGIMQPNQLEFESQKQPAPIEFKNNNNNLNKNAQGGGASGKKKAPNQKMGFLEGHIQAMMAAKKLKKAHLVPGSASTKKKEIKVERPAAEFNLDTRPSKYFDANIDPKSKREQERDLKQRQEAKKKSTYKPNRELQAGQPVVEKDEEGKIEVGYLRSNGQVGQKFEVYNNIEGIKAEVEKKQQAVGNFSMKKLFPQAQQQRKITSALSHSPVSGDKRKRSPSSGGKKSIQIAQSQVALNQDEFLRKMDESSNKKDLSIHHHSSSAVLNQVIGTETDMKLHHLVGQALQQKEAMIKVLEEQLNAERLRREEISNKFRMQLSEFEQERDAVEKLRKVSNQLERKQIDRSQISLSQNNTELDLIPTKESHRSSKNQKSSKASLALTYNPNRVKSSIPKMNVVVPQAKIQKAPSQEQQNKYLEELHVQEVQRSIKIKRDEDIAAEVVRKLRDNPNEHINELQTEVALLNRKVEPLLKRVEEAAKNVKIATDSQGGPLRKGPLGMLSKMGGRLISFYADDLAELLLQDFLAETAVELQNMESKQQKNYSGEEAKSCAEALMKGLVDYQSEEALIQMRWQNPSSGGAKGFKKVPKGVTAQGIAFNLNDNKEFNVIANASIEESQSASKQMKKYENPFTSQAVDPFSLKLKANENETSLRSQPGHIEFDNAKLQYEEPKRRYRAQLDKPTLQNIQLYREKYEKYLKMHNNTANKDVWKVYDHIAADIFHELFSQSLTQVQKDMEEYIDKVIVDEFQIGV